MSTEQKKERPDDYETFVLLNEDGEEVECTLLFTFQSEETGKTYIIYTDNAMNERGEVQIYAGIADPESDESELLPIETEEEWKMIETILKDIQNSVEESGEEGLDKEELFDTIDRHLEENRNQ